MSDEETTSQDRTTEDAAEWAAMQRQYFDLRSSLVTEDDPKQRADLLRKLADYREAIGELDHRMGRGPTIDADGRTMRLNELDLGDVAPRTSRASTSVPVGPDVGHRSGEHNIVAPKQLTIRYLIEGGPGPDAALVAKQLGAQLNAELAPPAALAGGTTVSWFESSAGSFEGEPIRFEVCHLDGSPGRQLRRYMRSIADLIILVVDSAPDRLAEASPYAAEVQFDRASFGEEDSPDLAVFANAKGDDIGDPDAVRDYFSLPAETRVLATASDKGGFLYAFTLATSGAVRRVQRRDEAGLARTFALSHSEFLFLLRDGGSIEDEHAPEVDHRAGGDVSAEDVGTTGPSPDPADDSGRDAGAATAMQAAAPSVVETGGVPIAEASLVRQRNGSRSLSVGDGLTGDVAVNGHPLNGRAKNGTTTNGTGHTDATGRSPEDDADRGDLEALESADDAEERALFEQVAVHDAIVIDDGRRPGDVAPVADEVTSEVAATPDTTTDTTTGDGTPGEIDLRGADADSESVGPTPKSPLATAATVTGPAANGADGAVEAGNTIPLIPLEPVDDGVDDDESAATAPSPWFEPIPELRRGAPPMPPPPPRAGDATSTVGRTGVGTHNPGRSSALRPLIAALKGGE